MEPAQEKRFEVVAVPERLHAGNAKDSLRHVRAEPGSFVVFDLTSTVAIDSTALGEIVRIHRTLVPTGGSVVFAGASKAIRRVLAITRLDSLLPIYPDLQSVMVAPGRPS